MSTSVTDSKLPLSDCGRRAAMVGALSALCLTVGCAHSAPAPQPCPPAPVQPQARADAGVPRPTAALPPQREVEPDRTALDETADWDPVPPRIEDYMADHFAIATWSRDAVINGVLEALREPLQAIADFDYSPVTPESWMPRVRRMQAAARVTASADSLTIAAAGVAAMAQQCGDCHAEHRQGAYFGPDIQAPRSPPPDSLGERMQRHSWAADRMWEGLTGPSNEAWNAGASALARAPGGSPASEPPLPADFVTRLHAVREIGKSALEARRREERAKVYGMLIASCADCHTRGYDFVF
jgi:cytochrome c553